MTNTPSIERLTRPIIGIENRSALEVFDIMADRIRSTLTPSAGEAEREQRWKELAYSAIDAVHDAERETDWGRPTFGPSVSEALRAEYDTLASLAPPPLPLPHPDIEGRARELLAAEYREAGYHNNAEAIRLNQLMSDERISLRAIVKALSLPTTEIRREALEEAAKVVDERAEACRACGVQGGIDPIEATILDEHLSEAAAAIRSLASKEEGRL